MRLDAYPTRTITLTAPMEPLARIFGSPARLKTLRLLYSIKMPPLRLPRLHRGPSYQRVRCVENSREFSSGLVRKKGTGVSPALPNKSAFRAPRRARHLYSRYDKRAPKEHTRRARRAGHCGLPRSPVCLPAFLNRRLTFLSLATILMNAYSPSSRALFDAELGREIRYASFETEDFRYRLGAYDRLLRDVFDYPHSLLIDKIGL